MTTENIRSLYWLLRKGASNTHEVEAMVRLRCPKFYKIFLETTGEWSSIPYDKKAISQRAIDNIILNIQKDEEMKKGSVPVEPELVEKEGEGEGEESMKDYITHNLDDLISLLNEVRKTHGNIPVVYHDQDVIVKMKPENLMKVSDGVMLFGGFHMNGEEFW